MIIVDTALEQRVRDKNPIRVALVGAGFSGRTVAYQILTAFPGIRLVVIYNRTIDRALEAYRAAGVHDPVVVRTTAELEQAMGRGRYAVTDDPSLVSKAEGVEAVIENLRTVLLGATGDDQVSHFPFALRLHSGDPKVAAVVDQVPALAWRCSESIDGGLRLDTNVEHVCGQRQPTRQEGCSLGSVGVGDEQ